jgi:hypothetical protein
MNRSWLLNTYSSSNTQSGLRLALSDTQGIFCLPSPRVVAAPSDLEEVTRMAGFLLIAWRFGCVEARGPLTCSSSWVELALPRHLSPRPRGDILLHLPTSVQPNDPGPAPNTLHLNDRQCPACLGLGGSISVGRCSSSIPSQLPRHSALRLLRLPIQNAAFAVAARS